MANAAVSPLPVEALRRICDPGRFRFQSTAELPPLDQVVGQERALRAISFGVSIKSEGYHLYALGPVGTGKSTTIRKYLEREARQRATPDDWLYVNNFNDQDRPRAIRLPAGLGRKFRDDMDQLVEELKTEVPAAFEDSDYEQEREQLENEFQRRSKALLQELEQKAKARRFTILQMPQGLMVAPLVDGDILTPDDFEKLREDQRAELESSQEELQSELRETMRRVEQLQKEGRERARELDQRVVRFSVDHLIAALKKKYSAHEVVVTFLEEASAFLLKNVPAFKNLKQLEQAPPDLGVAMVQSGQQPSFDEYRVNLVVDNSETEGAPLAHERNPTGPNLVGRIEHQGQFGALVTNFRLLKGGALHRCNGGYLMIDAVDLLTKPLAWEVLKRALKNKEIVIESMSEILGGLITRTLQPEPIPLDLKVILVGEPRIHYLLYKVDPDFRELFKVKADFEDQLPWDGDALDKYARFVGTVCREESLCHFDPTAVAKLVEQGSRLVSHQAKLATRFGDVVDLIRQASYWAGWRGADRVTAEDVSRAVDEQIYRANRIEERLREMIEEETILIDTAGEAVGQVNGLSVMPLGDYAFGRPSRVTASAHVGTRGVVNIDREAKLGGPIHNKGAMILSGYLGSRFALEVPLALSANVVFEQLYSGVEGDSASSTELYALLSRLAGFAVRQDLAVTGSVNQQGEVQAIGGVNEKIEGFFEVCRIKGFTGTQGVVIPRANVKHLMLHEKVVDAVREGRFHIYPVATIEEGIALLTGREAGERRPDGSYPPGSVNDAVQRRILELAEKARNFGNGPH